MFDQKTVRLTGRPLRTRQFFFHLFDTLNGMAVARPCRGSRNSILISIKNSAMSQHIADRPNSS